MKEFLEIRINKDYADLLFREDEGKAAGSFVKVVELSTSDPRYRQIPVIAANLMKEKNAHFYFGWKIKRKYKKSEIRNAPLLHMKIDTIFEPAGEERGTTYDEASACSICGANASQTSPLMLSEGDIPKKDIAETIAGEVVVSERFVKAAQKVNLRGVKFEPILYKSSPLTCSQLFVPAQLELSDETVVGVSPFDFSAESGGEIYKCPKGHTMGLNLISEPCILAGQPFSGNDLFSSRQKIGVRRGLLRQTPLYLCSQLFMEMVEMEKLTGFDFEIVNVA